MPVRFDHPHLLWLGLLALPTVLLGLRSRTSLESPRRWTAIILRLTVLAALVLMLAGVQAVRWHHDLTVVAVIDQSESVRRLARPPAPVNHRGSRDDQTGPPAWTEHRIAQWLDRSSANHGPDDRLGVVVYDGQPTVSNLPSTDFQVRTGSLVEPTEGTDTASAIRLAMALFAAHSGKRMVLVSDGNDTSDRQGQDLLAAAGEARAAGIPIDVLPVEYRIHNEVMVEGLYAPMAAAQGQTVSLRVVLRAARPADGSLYLEHDGQLLDLNGPSRPGQGLPVAAAAWWSAAEPDDAEAPPHTDENAATAPEGGFLWVQKIEVTLDHAGANRFEAIFEPAAAPADGDTMTANNRAGAFTFVHGRARLLLIDNVGSEGGSTLPALLRGHGIDLDRVSPYAVPTRLAGLHNYDAVVLQNVPAEIIPVRQQQQLARYVNDLGGGLIMIGGPDGFGAGGWTGSPVDHILPIECRVPSQTLLPSGALVLVLDRSGSMGGSVAGSPYTKQQIANEAAVLALNTLYPQDMVGVIAFDNSPRWVVRLQTNADPGAIAKRVRAIQPGGGTQIYPALEQAYDALATLDTQQAAVKHVVLLTDGHSVSAGYDRIIRTMASARITVSTIGVGDSVNGPLLARLAQAGGGTYYPVPDPNHLPQVFIKEARTIRKNLIKETPFNPRLVQTGSPVMAGMEAVPRLDGFVVTGLKADKRVYTPIVGPAEEPIFAHWRVGLGSSAAFTSDASNRWAAPWLQWTGHTDFWLRTIRAVARPAASSQFDLLVWIEHDNLHIRLDTASADTLDHPTTAAFTDSATRVSGTILGPDDAAIPVRLQHTAPGVYQAVAPAPAPGSYVVTLFVHDRADRANGRSAGRMVVGGVSRQAGHELRFWQSNRRRLEQVAMMTGGRVLDPSQPARLFDRDAIVASRSIRPLMQTLICLLLALFLADVAFRRMAWTVVSLQRWGGQGFQPFGGLLRSRPIQAAATLAALKHRAAEVGLHVTGRHTSDHDAPSGTNVTARGPSTAPTPPQARPRPPHDPTHTPTDPAVVNNDPAPTTSRLLDAKRRAHNRMESDHDS